MADKKHRKKTRGLRSKVVDDALPPVAADVSVNRVKKEPTQSQCFGNRKFSEVLVQTFSDQQTKSCNDNVDAIVHSSNEVAASSSSSKMTCESPDAEQVTFFFGNPFIEKTSGILHFYKRGDTNIVSVEDCSIICMIGVPSFLTCHELLKFISPFSEHISSMKVVRDSSPNQYMVIVKFRSHSSTVRFYHEYNSTSYNAIEPEQCTLLFVEKIESISEEACGSLPLENMTELPICAVCLERMDDGVVTILCNHTFHAICLEKWADTTCPVCRHSQTPELVADQKCFDCGKTTDLWICLICGNIGCGRYADAHAYRHFEATSHTFTLQIGGERVWDYAGDNYVHRLIQSATDGKMVEYQRAESESGETDEDKLEKMQLEYTYLLTSQLEQQRTFFEKKLAQGESRYTKLEKYAHSQIEGLEAQVKRVVEECENLKKNLASCTHGRINAEKKQQALQNKLNKASAELEEERGINQLLRSDQEKWANKLATVEKQSEEMQKKFSESVHDLNEQIRDLMMHFEAQNKINDALETNKITQEEISEGKMVVSEAERVPLKGRRRFKK